MDRTVNLERETGTATDNCDNCGRILGTGWIFGFKAKGVSGATGQAAEVIKCFFCALRHQPLVRRSMLAAAVVGTVLTLLNQGDAIISGNLSGSLYWKIPLTYCVPFIVATYGALSNNLK